MRIRRLKWFYLFWLVLSDTILIYLSFRLAYEVRFFCPNFLEFFPATKGIPNWQLYQEALRALIPVWLLIFVFWGHLYRIRFQDAANEFLAITKSVALATLMVIAATFLYRRYEYSRLVIGIAFFVSITLLFISREFWKQVIRRVLSKVISSETVVLIGEGKSIETMTNLVKKDPHKIISVYSGKELSKVRAMIDTESSPREIYISGQLLTDENEDLQNLMDECEDHEIEIKILPILLEMRLGEIMVDDSLGLPILHLKPLSLHGFRFLMKRLFDVSLSILIVSVLFFPFLLVAFLIILDSKGGVFFMQERVGFKEKRFGCLKFRTMHQNAETLLEEMKLPSFRGGPAFKMKGDPRITRVGKWLRKFSLDELPQIWNVLRGEMSLIGPRPQVLAEAEGNPEWARRRYRILPGITGLWQVSGRADLTYEDMMRLDIFYLENWSPGLDLRILLDTIPVVLSGKGAY